MHVMETSELTCSLFHMCDTIFLSSEIQTQIGLVPLRAVLDFERIPPPQL